MKFKNDKFKSRLFQEIGPYINLGWELISIILLMTFIGWIIDKWLSTQPTFIIIFALLGCTIGLYEFIRNALRK